MSDVPLWVWKLVLRIKNLANQSPFITVHIMRIDGQWYLQTGNGAPEKLGE